MNIYTLLITIGITFFPILLLKFLATLGYIRLVNNKFYSRQLFVLITAGIIYPVARYLPEPTLTDESVTLVQHFVGGGFISALYFIYFTHVLKIKQPQPVMIGLLYLVTSGLGVANELLEFLATKLQLYSLDSSDVWWDLTANTAGAITLYILFIVCKNLKKNRSSQIKL